MQKTSSLPEIPETPETLGPPLAKLLQQHAAMYLVTVHGSTDPLHDVAAILGESPQRWREYIEGKLAPRETKLKAWSVAWDQTHGDSGFRVVFEGGAWRLWDRGPHAMQGASK